MDVVKRWESSFCSIHPEHALLAQLSKPQRLLLYEQIAQLSAVLCCLFWRSAFDSLKLEVS